MNAQTRKMTAGLEYLGMALCGKAGNGDENMATSNVWQVALWAWVGFIAVCLACPATSRAGNITNFEPSTYTAGTSYNGVDGWVTFSGTGNRSNVTPFYDADSGLQDNTVIAGTQSGSQKGEQTYRDWNGQQSLIGDGVEITWLMQNSGLSRTEVSVSDNILGQSSPLGIVLNAAGDIKMLTPNTGLFDAGHDYLIDKTYRYSLTIDFTGQTMTATTQNITDGGAVLALGTGNTGALNLANFQNQGGMIVVERDGLRMYVDNFAITDPPAPVPEPATIGLMMLGGTALLRRRRM
jgi:hypothetical protein